MATEPTRPEPTEPRAAADTEVEPRQTNAAATIRIAPEVYTGEYYLSNCHGYEDFLESRGQKVGPRFVKALALAGDLRGKRVLDVGCGRGEIVLQSALRGAEAWGIDYAPAAIEIAERALEGTEPAVAARLHLACMDVKALDLDDASFDVVFMMDVVEHLYPDELARAFEELHRVLRAGGRIVMHTSPNKVFEEVVYRQ